MDNSFLCFSISWTCSRLETVPGAGGARQSSQSAMVGAFCVWDEYEFMEQARLPSTVALSEGISGGRCMRLVSGVSVLLLLVQSREKHLGLRKQGKQFRGSKKTNLPLVKTQTVSVMVSQLQSNQGVLQSFVSPEGKAVSGQSCSLDR